jgi:1-deoxy-D-xylulose-5-phosphate reductoisomerase
MKHLSILGSTGSIGRSTLDVVDAFPDRVEVVALAAGANVELLAAQVKRYGPAVVSVKTESEAKSLRRLLDDSTEKTEIVFGAEGATAVATLAAADTVIAAIVGAAGVPPVYAALRAGKRVAIANKEVLVAAGELMTAAARESGGEILPVDSEHNAIHQALRCGAHAEVRRIILTASGGPFLQRDLATFPDITPEAALAHPTWRMGNKITVDSATMMNKGLEVIEAHHLFAMPVDKIDVMIHPQSVVHSMVEFMDGSIMAQLSTTDMKLPIQYALFYPDRVPAPFGRLDLTAIRKLEFFPLDENRFPAVRLAYEAARIGGSMPAVLSAANEIAVERFLRRDLSYPAIVETVARVMEKHAPAVSRITSLDEVLHWDAWARNEAASVAVATSPVAH